METKTAVNGGRIRKVTITEIENDQEWNWPDPGCLEEDLTTTPTVMTKSTEEVFDDLDQVVQDWKKKLEYIVADGLKTIKKTTKEKKTMMKYLPGDGLIGGSDATLKARCQILSEWKDEINRTFDKTHKKLNDLGNDKVQETTAVVDGIAPPENDEVKNNECTTVSLDFDTLMRDLDYLYQKYNMNNMNKVPIYNVQKDFYKMKNAPFPWWKPIGTYAQLMDSPNQFINPTERDNNCNNVLSILQDFVADQRSQKSIMQEWKKMEEGKKKSSGVKKDKKDKTARRGRDSTQKMKERREIRRYKQFLLREIVRKGETHYYLMKKEMKEPVITEVEDIFADWNKNLGELKRPKTIRPRTRKISHRAERKEMIKQEMKREVQGPLTYSQMLRKNLKISNAGPEVEEIFGPWMKNVEKMYKPLKKTNAPDDVEVFNNWNFIFEKSVTRTPPTLEALECGQPTVLRPTAKAGVAKQNVKKQSIEKLSAKLLAEGYPLGHSDDKSGQPKAPTTVAVRNNKTEVVPFVERKPLVPSLSKVEPAAKGFKPSQHAQRCVLMNDIPQQTFIGPINKPRVPTPPPMPSFNWKELLQQPSPPEQSGRGETALKSYKTEEIFDQWRHIFIDANKEACGPKARKMTVKEYKQDIYFMEWLRNLEEPVLAERKKGRMISGGEEQKTPSPPTSKRAEKKLVRTQNIEDDVTEIKDNRRQDFAKARKIKDKKRTEASRNSLGKRVK